MHTHTDQASVLCVRMYYFWCVRVLRYVSMCVCMCLKVHVGTYVAWVATLLGS